MEKVSGISRNAKEIILTIAEYGSGHPSGLISHEIVGSNPTSATIL